MKSLFDMGFQRSPFWLGQVGVTESSLYSPDQTTTPTAPSGGGGGGGTDWGALAKTVFGGAAAGFGALEQQKTAALTKETAAIQQKTAQTQAQTEATKAQAAATVAGISSGTVLTLGLVGIGVIAVVAIVVSV